MRHVIQCDKAMYIVHHYKNILPLYIFTYSSLPTPTAVTGGRVFTSICLCVCLFYRMISQEAKQLGTPNVTQKCFKISPRYPIILGSKGQRPRSQVTKNIAGMDLCMLVSVAFSSCYCHYCTAVTATSSRNKPNVQHNSTDHQMGKLLLEWIWSSHLHLGSPEEPFKLQSGSCPSEMSIWHWCAWCGDVFTQPGYRLK